MRRCTLTHHIERERDMGGGGRGHGLTDGEGRQNGRRFAISGEISNQSVYQKPA